MNFIDLNWLIYVGIYQIVMLIFLFSMFVTL